MAPTVTLDVLPADLPAHYAPAMVEACSGALAEGVCALAADLPESVSPQAIGLVLWQGPDMMQVTVRVGRGGGQWLVRALTFSERDSVAERWTTVGLTVATLAGETRAIDEGVEPPNPQLAMPPVVTDAPAAPPRAPQLPPPSLRPEPKLQWLGAFGALAGPAWDAGDWQLGGWVVLTLRASRLPFQIHATGSYALSRGPTVRLSELRTRWLTAGLGAGVYGQWPQLSLLGSAALDLAYRRADAELDGEASSDEELPLRLRATASFPAAGPVGAMLGTLVRLPPQNARGSEGGRVQAAALTFELLAGVEVRL